MAARERGVAKIAAHGAAGGTLTELQGGKFGHGFVSAGVTEAFSPAVGSIDNVPAQAVAYAAIGGTASKLAGDSFSNGAVTAIYQFLFNTVVHSASDIAKANARLAAASAKAGEIAGQGYTTADDARLAAANRWVPDAYITGKEANWYIVQLSDLSFGYTYPNVGLAGQSQVSPVTPSFVLAQSSNGISVSSINSLAHNHLRGDANFSDYDRQLVDSPRYRKYPLWLWNENGNASMLRSGANIGGISGARTYSGVRIQNMDIPVTW